MHKVQTSVENLVAASAILAAELQPLADTLVGIPHEEFSTIFEIGIVPIKIEPPKKSAYLLRRENAEQVRKVIGTQSAKFSSLLTLAHAVNRRHGHAFTKGCACNSCRDARKAA